MAKADVIALAQRLACDQAHEPSLESFYDEELWLLSLGAGFLVEATFIEITAGIHTYSPPDNVSRPVAVYYDDKEIPLETLSGLLGAFGRDWSTQSGAPRAYTIEDENSRDFRLVPTPDVGTTDRVPAVFDPFGRDFKSGGVTLIATDTGLDLPRWLELPVALRILGREFSRPSDHRHMALAEQYARLGALTYRMLA